MLIQVTALVPALILLKKLLVHVFTDVFVLDPSVFEIPVTVVAPVTVIFEKLLLS